MNLPMRLLLAAAVVTLITTAFTAFPKKTLPKDAPRAKEEAKQIMLYWYTYPYDFYNDYKNIADEEYELWAMYGFPVNQTIGGGTLLMRGYVNNANPHNQLPYVFLYGHFPFMVDGPGRPTDQTRPVEQVVKPAQ